MCNAAIRIGASRDWSIGLAAADYQCDRSRPLRMPPRSLIRTFTAAILLAAAASAQAPESKPVLTIDKAVELALQGNRRVRSSALEVHRAHEGTAAVRTQRLPQFQIYALGGETLRPISFTIPEGALGVYPNTGPIPAQSSKITTPQQFTGLILAQATQPLSQLWKVHLATLSSQIGEALAQESLRRQRQETAYSVRDLYYQIVQTQSLVESAESNVKYLAELQEETNRNLAQQTALKGDSLMVKAKLSRQRYQLLILRDTFRNQCEALNQLLGRDLGTEFIVEAQPAPSPSEIDVVGARQEAMRQRAEVRQARLQIRQTENDVRRQRAEYIPDLSVHFTSLSLPNVNFLPQNIMQAGLMLQWQPFDWGQKHHKTEALKDAAQEASLSEQDAEQQVLRDVNGRFRALAESRASLDTEALNQEAEREKLRVVTNRYAQKAALLSDVLQQQAALAQADADYRKALAAFWSAKASFDHALGRE